MTVKRGLVACAAVLACATIAPAAANAATMTNAGGTLTFTGNGNTVNHVSFAQSTTPGDNTVTVTNNSGDNDPITPTGCTTNSPTSFTCANVTTMVIDAAGLDDEVDVGSFRGSLSLAGGTGDDFLSVTNDSGPATINGGEGDDGLTVSLADSVTGGPTAVNGGNGVDNANFSVSLSAPAFSAARGDVALSLDGVANDGLSGQGANFATDIEDASATSSFDPGGGANFQFGGITLSGSGGANQLNLYYGDGNDTIDGLAGSDDIYSGAGNDTVNARDGYADRVNCGPGTDTANVDTLDQVSASCENVTTADVGNANDDRPPTITWGSPAAGAKLPGNNPTTLTVNAADDHGVTQVQFLDDDRVVCTDTTAPFTCAYQARGNDVGRNTLVAVASDAVGQTASSVRTVLVDRFTASSVSLTLKPSKDKKAPYKFTATGKVSLPAGVSSTLGCSGVVAVSAKSGSKTISTRTDSLSKTCVYSVTVSFSSRARLPKSGKLKFQATFRGNEVLQTKRSAAKNASTK